MIPGTAPGPDADSQESSYTSIVATKGPSNRTVGLGGLWRHLPRPRGALCICSSFFRSNSPETWLSGLLGFGIWSACSWLLSPRLEQPVSVGHLLAFRLLEMYSVPVTILRTNTSTISCKCTSRQIRLKSDRNGVTQSPVKYLMHK